MLARGGVELNAAELAFLEASRATARGRERRARGGALVLIVALPGSASAHGVGEDDGSFLATNQGLAAGPYAYLGAKHMFTGADHLEPKSNFASWPL